MEVTLPRTGGVYSPPAGTKGVSNTTIQSVPYNAFVDDLEADANAARPVTAGGTGSTTASGARTNLGLAIGTNVQAYDAGLQSISGLTTSADRMIYTTASDVYATTALTPFARTILDDATAGAALTTLGVSAFVQTVLDDADAASARATLGLTIGTNVQAFDTDLTAIAALVSAANKLPYATGSGTWALSDLTAFGRTLVDDADASTALTTLGVSTYVKTLLDDIDAAAARATLGLGSLATASTINNANWSGTALSVANGGTGSTTAAAARTALGTDSASNLTAGTLPSARLTGAYTSGVTDFTMSGLFTVANSAPIIRLQDTTASAYDGRLRLDANNLYIDGSSDGATYAEVLRFELDTKIGYMNQLFLGSSGEAIRLNAPTAGQDPYVSFYAGGVRQAYIQSTDGTGVNQGLRLYNDIATGGDTALTLKNSGGVDSLEFQVAGVEYTVFHTGNLTSADLNSVYGYTAASTAVDIIAGNGLTGGGAISADRTLAIGTPSTLTATSTNSVGADTHAHDVDWGGGVASIAAGAVGSYAWCQRVNNTTGYTLGQTVPGTDLESASSSSGGGAALSGTWRCMGNIGAGSTAGGSLSLFLRIS